MSSLIERRTHPRVTVDYSVFYYYTLPNHPETKMLNLSMEGAAIEALDPFPVGARTSFVFVLGKAQVVHCQARVVSVAPLPNSKYRIGVRFTELSDEGRQLVARATQSDV